MSTSTSGKSSHKPPPAHSAPPGNQLPPLPTQPSNAATNNTNVPPLQVAPTAPTVEPFPLATPTTFTVTYGTTPNRRLLVNNDCRIHVILDYIRTKVCGNIKHEMSLKRKDISAALAQAHTQETFLNEELQKVKTAIAEAEAAAAAALVNASMDGANGTTTSRPATTEQASRASETTSSNTNSTPARSNPTETPVKEPKTKDRERRSSKSDREREKSDKNSEKADKEKENKDEGNDLVSRRKALEDMLQQLRATVTMITSVQDRLVNEETVVDSIIDVTVVDNFNNTILQRFSADISAPLQALIYEDPFLAAAQATQSAQNTANATAAGTGKGSTGTSRLRGARDSKDTPTARAESHPREHDNNSGNTAGNSPISSPSHANRSLAGANKDGSASADGKNVGTGSLFGPGASAEVTVVRPQGDRATAAQAGQTYRLGFVTRNTIPPVNNSGPQTPTTATTAPNPSSPFTTLANLDLTALDTVIPAIPRYHVAPNGVVALVSAPSAASVTTSK